MADDETRSATRPARPSLVVPSPSQTGGDGHFPTTNWSVVIAAGRAGSPHSKDALATLCNLYWQPLYSFVRRRGYDADAAQELTQEFFVRLLEGNDLADADPKKGKLRSFLLAALTHLLSNERDYANAKKRGGGKVLFSLDVQSTEQWYAREPVDRLTPERLFDKRWALTTMERVFDRLRDEYVSAGQGGRFERLRTFLYEKKKASGSYDEIAGEFGVSSSAVRQAVHRLRERFGELLRAEVGATVAAPDQVEEELREMLLALSY